MFGAPGVLVTRQHFIFVWYLETIKMSNVTNVICFEEIILTVRV
jgi:hypothetical protein